jgi:hypothetical protein
MAKARCHAWRESRRGLRVKRVQATSGVFEMTWAPDGRATWQYGTPVRPGLRHIRLREDLAAGWGRSCVPRVEPVSE